MLDATPKPTGTGERKARAVSLASWVFAAAALALMAWLGFVSSPAEFVPDGVAAERLQFLWRVHGWAAAGLFVCWLPFAVGWRILPVAATGICTLGTLLAVFGIPFYRDTDLVWIYWTTAAVLGVCALAQLAVRFPRSKSTGVGGN